MRQAIALLPLLPEEYILSIQRNINTTKQIDIYIDIEEEREIIKVLISNPKKTSRILVEMLNGHYNNDLYGKENISEEAKDITAMKYKGKPNIRVYCKEYIDEDNQDKKIILIWATEKKTQEINKKLKTRIEIIGSYDYEFN